MAVVVVGCTLSTADRARSNRRLGQTPKSSSPTTTAATAVRPHRSRQTSTCAASVGSDFIYIAMMTGREYPADTTLVRTSTAASVFWPALVAALRTDHF